MRETAPINADEAADVDEGPSILPAGALLAPAYGVLAHLHRSSILDVYDVWSEERACRCVAKLLRPDRADEPRERRRLLDEGRLLQRLTHPHLVRAYETLEQPQPIVILETLTGATLARVIQERRLRAADLAFLGLHLASAMHYLHRQGYLHLDLKPSNIILAGGLARVIDLSIARPPGPGRRGVGTRSYLAPEQARGDLLGPAADVWGIGAVLFEAASGLRPFQANDASRRFEQLERRADPIRAHRRLPPLLAATIDRCLEPDPSARPSTDELLRTTASLT